MNELSTNELPAVDFKAHPTRPVLGPSLWLFGALLWAYVIAGELVVRSGFPEPLGWLGVLFVLGVTWFFAIERSFVEDPPAPNERLKRALSPLVAALGLWIATLIVSTLIGATSRGDLDGLITVGLWLLSLAPFFGGRRMTGNRRPPIDPSRRPLGILLWIGAALVTLVALIPVLE
ncbi:MAG TPA: hypothetical protein VG937_36515 [Polyangiaceae bacterium]|nr:hypothetical protein [Polyangiaceae bacterium]